VLNAYEYTCLQKLHFSALTYVVVLCFEATYSKRDRKYGETLLEIPKHEHNIMRDKTGHIAIIYLNGLTMKILYFIVMYYQCLVAEDFHC
jgi:hypothetical protein